MHGRGEEGGEDSGNTRQGKVKGDGVEIGVLEGLRKVESEGGVGRMLEGEMGKDGVGGRERSMREMIERRKKKGRKAK